MQQQNKPSNGSKMKPKLNPLSSSPWVTKPPLGVLDDNLTAKQMWTILTNQFNPNSALQQLTLAREIQELQLGKKIL